MRHTVFESASFDDHENVSFISDAKTGLKAIIAVHSSALGPAAGGCRMLPYVSTQAAMEDVLRLSRGMTYKNAVAGLPLGGGKAVIIANPKVANKPEILKAFGRAVERLSGYYWTAEDMNISTDDMAVIASETKYAAGLQTGHSASGNPSPVTAKGVFEGIKVAMKHRFGHTDLNGVMVAVQGIGNVGFSLCEMLHKAGAKLVVSDTNTKSISSAVEMFNARVVEGDQIYSAEADVFAPCAMGAILNEETIPQLKAKIVAGAANNQLAHDGCGQMLKARDILYAPDYVINGGGIINVSAEIFGNYNEQWVSDKVDALMMTLDQILGRAISQDRAPHAIADEVALERINGNVDEVERICA